MIGAVRAPAILTSPVQAERNQPSPVEAHEIPILANTAIKNAEAEFFRPARISVMLWLLLLFIFIPGSYDVTYHNISIDYDIDRLIIN